MKKNIIPLDSQRGVALLEALISILILSFGILAIIGLQATSVRLSTDAKYRSDAALVVNQLVGEMLSGDRTTATLQAAYQTGNVSYDAWRTRAQALLPGVATNQPTVVFGANGLVTITLFWQAPGGGPVHRHQVVTQIVGCSGVC